MASRQDKEERAASDISDVNREREQERHGVIGSVMKAMQSAREAVVGKSHDEDAEYYAGDRGDSTDMTMMAKETTESAARMLDERAREAAERTKQTAESAKEKTKEQGDIPVYCREAGRAERQGGGAVVEEERRGQGEAKGDGRGGAAEDGGDEVDE